MAEPDSHAPHLLREIRAAIQALDTRTERVETKVDLNHAEVTERLDRLRQAISGESVLGRYAAAEVEERLAAIEQRLSLLEGRG